MTTPQFVLAFNDLERTQQKVAFLSASYQRCIILIHVTVDTNLAHLAKAMMVRILHHQLTVLLL